MTSKKYRSVSLKALFCVLSYAALSYAGASPALADGEQAGVAAAVHGEVQIVSLVDQVGHQIESGEPIFLGDEIKSGPESGLQILLMDETVFTIGPESALAIDKFVYDPSSGIGSVSARVLKGTFRFITGKVAQENPSDMVVKLPNGVIGVRGTIVAGRVDGNESMIVLLGPGQDNNASARIGRIVVEGDGNQVEITRPGWGTTISGIGGPASPVQVPASEIIALTGSFKTQKVKKQEDEDQSGGDENQKDGSPESKDGDQKNEDDKGGKSKTTKKGGGKLANTRNASRQAGQDKAKAIKFTHVAATFAEVTEEADEESSEESAESASAVNNIADGQTYNNQLFLVPSGVFHWNSTGSFTQTAGGGGCPCVGTATVKMNIDFGARTIGGGTSGIAIDTTGAGGDINDGALISSFTYDDGEGGFAEGYFKNHLTGTNPTFFEQSTGALLNSGGVIANGAEFKVIYDDSSTKYGTGTVTDTVREAGLAP